MVTWIVSPQLASIRGYDQLLVASRWSKSAGRSYTWERAINKELGFLITIWCDCCTGDVECVSTDNASVWSIGIWFRIP